MESITTFEAKIAALPVSDIDTDQIIPARFLKTTNKAGLGDGLFSDWRYNADGTPKPDFVLNRPDVQGAQVLIAGNNFGCGSSREHAPWALTGYGFKAVVSTFFADIFKSNALKNGLVPIVVDEDTLYQLFSLFEEDPSTTVVVDIPNQALVLPGGQTVKFPIDPFAKHCLVHGVDQMGFLLNEDSAISEFESARTPRVQTVA
ncbi:3-isopropylmalate dehydratase small subunit [Chloroflexia bacterium SDU3-3]|nr:3-isopropylmalate dehydratase small subunit [Chloroflexia bacterium SDU3-3]